MTLWCLQVQYFKDYFHKANEPTPYLWTSWSTRLGVQYREIWFSERDSYRLQVHLWHILDCTIVIRVHHLLKPEHMRVYQHFWGSTIKPFGSLAHVSFNLLKLGNFASCLKGKVTLD